MQNRSACRRVGAVLIGVCALLITGPLGHWATQAWADEPSNAALKADIEVLKKRLAQLEAQMATQDAMPPTAGEAPLTAGKTGLPTLQLPSGLEGLQLTGYVDTSYVFNFNRPDAGSRTNLGRVFDVNANGFTIQAAELVLEKPVTDSVPIGFRTDLFFGDDAEVIHATGLGNVATGDKPLPFDLQQAYITLRAPVGAGLDFKVGKFVTLLGAEVIESPANWNFSRSFLFGYAIPFTHTGVVASYPLGEWGSTSFGLVNGWDLADESNSFKTMLGQLSLTPLKGVTLSSTLITGAERASDNGNDRTVLDLVATWQPLDKLILMTNYDYGHEGSVSPLAGSPLTLTAGGGPGTDSANWQGWAFYAKYDLTPTWNLASRFEWFNDRNDVRIALGGPDGAPVRDLGLFEWTLTSQWTLREHVLARLEFRHDSAGERVFAHTGSGFKTYQDTVAAEMIYHF